MLFYWIMPRHTLRTSAPKTMFFHGYTAALVDIGLGIAAVIYLIW